MSSLSYSHSISNETLLKRFRLWSRQYLHVVFCTSLLWIFIDVFLIMLFSDCTKEIIVPCSSTLSNNNKPKINDRKYSFHPKIIIDQTKNEDEIKFKNNENKIETTKRIDIHKWWNIDPSLY